MKASSRIIVCILIVMLLSLLVLPLNITRAQQEKIYVAFIWHYHQPWYYSPDEAYFILPWVRMHSVGNYYKMAYILSKYPDIKVTFTFSGSLLEQIADYVENGKMDLREIISWRIVNGTLTMNDVFNMLRIPGGFFDINWARIVEKSPRYRGLRDTAQALFSNCSRIATTEEELVNCVVMGFTRGNLLGQEVIDLAVMFNLLWIDPQVAQEQYPDIRGLMARAYSERYPNFTVDDLRLILSVHRDIMSKIIPLYKDLAARGQIEIIPVPYSHPLAPLLADAGLDEDLEVHVNLAVNLFRKHFNFTPTGVWPAEHAVNEYVVRAFKRAGVNWTVTDQSILAATGADVGNINNLGVPWYIDFPEGKLYIVFRETTLSNLISFQYSGWDQDQAVNDLVNRILAYRSSAQGPRLVVVALDGENPWEHYPEFGTVFLNKLYSRLSELQSQGQLETVTPWEFIQRFPGIARELPLRNYEYLDLAGKDISNIPQGSYGDAYSELPRRTVTARLPEGSWGGDLATWIGQRQENAAWMWMIKAREDTMRVLGVSSFRDLYAKYPNVAKYLLKAQASDWWWWYGGDGGGSAAPFDPLFKAYLRRVYELSNMTAPQYLLLTAYPDGTPIGTLNTVPPSIAERPPVIDGQIEALWSQLVSENRALRVLVGRLVREVYVALDTQILYFAVNMSVSDLRDVAVGVYFTTPNTSLSPYMPGFNLYPRSSNIDLGIYLAREILVDFTTRKAYVNTATNGTWSQIHVVDVYVSGISGSYSAEFSVKISDLELAEGELAYMAVVVYINNTATEWSSRLGLAYQLFIPKPVGIVGKVIFEMSDPTGDDDGPGGFKYPRASVFIPGVFDLVKFTVRDAGDKVVFVFTFRELGGNPWNGPNGWSMQQVHVYIKTTLSVEGRYDTFGLNATVAHGWHMALIVAPGWGTDPVPVGEKTGLYYYDKETPLVQDSSLRAYADPTTKSIIVEVSKAVLYDVENIADWVYVVAVTSHDGYGPQRIRPFIIGGGEWAVEVPSTTEYAQATLAGVIPRILDLLAPTASDQYNILRSFNAVKREPAKLIGVSRQGLYTLTPSLTPTETPTTTTPTVSTILELLKKPEVIAVIVVIIVVVALVAGIKIALKRIRE
jgi:alpha-amylase/alpha-mannosidase (GH57 family)